MKGAASSEHAISLDVSTREGSKRAALLSHGRAFTIIFETHATEFKRNLWLGTQRCSNNMSSMLRIGIPAIDTGNSFLRIDRY